MDLWNSSQTMGGVLQALTTNVFGSLFFTLLFLVTLVVVILSMFKIPLEFQAVIIMPFLLGVMAYTGQFVAIGGVVLILAGVVAAKTITRS